MALLCPLPRKIINQYILYKGTNSIPNRPYKGLFNFSCGYVSGLCWLLVVNFCAKHCERFTWPFSPRRDLNESFLSRRYNSKSTAFGIAKAFLILAYGQGYWGVSRRHAISITSITWLSHVPMHGIFDSGCKCFFTTK